jgi:signal-transduction protein with cAMP-binding, CBS, and nucleotidyltransferase domain
VAKVSARDAFHDLALTSAGGEINPALPDDEDNATVGAANFVSSAGQVDDQRSGPVGTSMVDLRSVENEDVFIALVTMIGNRCARLVVQECRRRTGLSVPVEAMDVHPGPKRRPLEIGSKNSLRKL